MSEYSIGLVGTAQFRNTDGGRPRLKRGYKGGSFRRHPQKGLFDPVKQRMFNSLPVIVAKASPFPPWKHSVASCPKITSYFLLAQTSSSQFRDRNFSVAIEAAFDISLRNPIP